MANFTLKQLLEKTEEMGKGFEKIPSLAYDFNRQYNSYQPPVTGKFIDTLHELVSCAFAVRSHIRDIKSYISKAEGYYDELIKMKGENNLPILNVSDRPKVKCIVDFLKSTIND